MYIHIYIYIYTHISLYLNSEKKTGTSSIASFFVPCYTEKNRCTFHPAAAETRLCWLSRVQLDGRKYWSFNCPGKLPWKLPSNLQIPPSLLLKAIQFWVWTKMGVYTFPFLVFPGCGKFQNHTKIPWRIEFRNLSPAFRPQLSRGCYWDQIP